MRQQFLRSVPIILLVLSTASAHAEVVTIDGTIKAVDAKKRTITVESDSKTQSLDVSSKAKITVDGKDAGLESLKAGQKVSLSYHDKLEVVLKIEAEASGASGGPNTVEHDMKLLTGDWLTVVEERNGHFLPKGEVKNLNRRIEIKGNWFRLSRVERGFGTYEGRIDINPATKPKAFDFVGKGPAGNHVEFKGIYEVNGTTLKLYYRYVKEPETRRPKTFRTTSQKGLGGNFMGLTCKRETD
jgi:uncharacterized protein (TIGR03067 family)